MTPLELKVAILEDRIESLELAVRNLYPIIQAVTPKDDELLVELMYGFVQIAKTLEEYNKNDN